MSRIFVHHARGTTTQATVPRNVGVVGFGIAFHNARKAALPGDGPMTIATLVRDDGSMCACGIGILRKAEKLAYRKGYVDMPTLCRTTALRDMLHAGIDLAVAIQA